jgi:hypothetical protein
MRIETVVEILRALPGVRVHWQEIERGRAEPTTLKVELSVDDTVRPGDRCGACGAPLRAVGTF